MMRDSPPYSNKMIDFGIPVVAACIVLLMVLLLHLCMRWVWGNSRPRWGGPTTDHVQHPRRMQLAEAAAAGLDKGVLDALPTFVYTKESMKEPLECSVCISEFQENETGRVLPKCNHCFHTACIDMWFNSHSTCPLCRANAGDQKPISHEDGAENMPVDEEMGL